MRVATVFSGIGAPEYALKHYFPGLDVEIVFACDCGETKRQLSEEEIRAISKIKDQRERQRFTKEVYSKIRREHRVKDTYLANNPEVREDQWYDDIRFIDGREYTGQVDLFVGGSPCQSFSLMGKRGGLEDVRGTLFYDYARLIQEIRPRVFVYENVPGMLVHDKGRTWQKIQEVFDSLHYRIFPKILDSSEYGMPQKRKRLFVVGFRDFGNAHFEFPEPVNLDSEAADYYEEHVPAKYFMKRKGFEFVTNPKYSGRATINQAKIRTEKRNQQFNWNGDFVFVPRNELLDRQDVLDEAYFGLYNGVEGAVRKLTPRECTSLMGFGNDFIICPVDVDAYKQAGNSIVVPTIAAVFRSILLTGLL